MHSNEGRKRAERGDHKGEEGRGVTCSGEEEIECSGVGEGVNHVQNVPFSTVCHLGTTNCITNHVRRQIL